MKSNKIKEFVKLMLETNEVVLLEKSSSVSKNDEHFSLASLDAQVDKRIKTIHKSSQEAEENYADHVLPADDDDDNVDKKQPKNIDINAFTQDVIKLIENFTQLVEIEDAVLRRASKFLKAVHGSQTVSAFEDALREAGYSIGKSEPEFAAETQPTTYGVGAGPSS